MRLLSSLYFLLLGTVISRGLEITSPTERGLILGGDGLQHGDLFGSNLQEQFLPAPVESSFDIEQQPTFLFENRDQAGDNYLTEDQSSLLRVRRNSTRKNPRCAGIGEPLDDSLGGFKRVGRPLRERKWATIGKRDLLNGASNFGPARNAGLLNDAESENFDSMVMKAIERSKPESKDPNVRVKRSLEPLLDRYAAFESDPYYTSKGIGNKRSMNDNEIKLNQILFVAKRKRFQNKIKCLQNKLISMKRRYDQVKGLDSWDDTVSFMGNRHLDRVIPNPGEMYEFNQQLRESPAKPEVATAVTPTKMDFEVEDATENEADADDASSWLEMMLKPTFQLRQKHFKDVRFL